MPPEKETSTSGETSADDSTLSIAQELSNAFEGEEAPGTTDDDLGDSGASTETGATDKTTATGDNSSQEKTDDKSASTDETPLAPHEHWSEEEKKAFGELPKPVQQIWLNRERQIEAGLNKKFQELSGFRKEREELQEIFAPFSRDMELAGISRTQAVKQLVAAHNFMQQDPIKGLSWMAESYGIKIADLPKLLQSQGTTSNPEVEALRRELEALKQTTGSIQTSAVEAQRAENLARVQQFATETDAQGNLKRPYFDELSDDILLLMRAGERDLEKAYERACWANPSTREKMQAATRAAEKAQQAQAVDKAKRAGFSVESTDVKAGTPLSLHDELAQGFANL